MGHPWPVHTAISPAHISRYHLPMADPFNYFVQALYIFGVFLEQVSPIPWPLGIAAFLPAYGLFLDIFVWWMRGTLWPLPCNYPNTTTGYPCRIGTVGEWHRCYRHNYIRRRKTDGHTVNPHVKRWQDITTEGEIVERKAVSGAGFLRVRSRGVRLLLHEGYAKPPRYLIHSFPAFWRCMRNEWEDFRRRLKKINFRWRDLLRPSATPAQLDVSDRLPAAIKATRFTLLFAALGLTLVIVAVSLRGNAKYSIIILIEYISMVMFVAAWAVARKGIWGERSDWLYEARWETAKTCILFVFFAGLAGLLDMVSRAVGAGF